MEKLSRGKKNPSQVKKNLSQSTVYIYQHTHTLQNPHKHTHYKTHTYIHKHTHYKTHTYTHTLQNNRKPPQYKLKQNAIGKATQWGERMAPSF
jgi:hypothetical protein